ncbi:MAG TPA: putative porin [Candidatus Aquilonibacter sp.]|nr:putative porin [Candidatus Aquilonibacter sp.]
MLVVLAADQRTWADATDPLLDLFVKKGYVTQKEAEQVEAEAETLRTNEIQTPPMPPSIWSFDTAIKKVELFGDVRVRYEDRTAYDPEQDKIELQRFRYALRFGLRGDVFDDFYYGFRLETSSNPRSSWVTMGTAAAPSSSNPAYQGPFGKSSGGIGIGQVYIGWRPENWVNITVGKMPNPLYTTPMVWSSTINPEGLAERFQYIVGRANFFANFAQFLYQDENPVSESGVLNWQDLGIGQSQENIFQIAWQGGLTYNITTNISAKVGATIYQYFGLKRSSLTSGNTTSPYFGDPYVGEGAYAGPGSEYPTYGFSGYGSASGLAGYESLNYPNNQVGLNNLLVLEIPFEVNFKIKNLDSQVFGDFAYNLEGAQRARAAAAGYAAYLASLPPPGATIGTFTPQTHDDKAYQIGFAIGSKDSLGLVDGSVSGRNAWELKTYWQHIEQYSLDPNLLDTDFFEGNENLQGIYAAFAYGFGKNVTGTVRYGYASRINKLLGTGGTGQDIPQMNPINSYSILQVDVTLRF